jgi:PAS domain-containing protein
MSPGLVEMQPIDGRDLIAQRGRPRSATGSNAMYRPKSTTASAHAIEQAIRTRSLFETRAPRHPAPTAPSAGPHSPRRPPSSTTSAISPNGFGTARDVTHRRRTEEDLTDIRSRMEAAPGPPAPIGTWSWGHPGRPLLGATPASPRIFSLDPDQVASSPLASVVPRHPPRRPPPRRRRPSQRPSTPAAATRPSTASSRPDGTCRWVKRPRPGGKLDPQGPPPPDSPGVVIDITDRKTAQQDLALLTDESDRRRRLYEDHPLQHAPTSPMSSTSSTASSTPTRPS